MLHQLRGRFILSGLCQAGLRLFILVCFCTFLVACGDKGESVVDVRLKTGPMVSGQSVPGDEEDKVRFVFASVLSPELSTISYTRFASYLTGHLGRRVEIVRRRTYAELNELLRTGNAEAGLICSGAYAVGREQFGLRQILVPIVYGKTSYQAYLISRRKSSFQSLDDLRERVFAFSDPLSNTGYRYVAAELAGKGTDPEHFFGHSFFTYSHDGTIQAVLDGIADAGTVDSLVWSQLVHTNPVVFKNLKILQQSEEFPINPIVVSPKAPAAFVRELRRILLEMPSDEIGREVLSDLDVSGFTDIAESRYDPIVQSWRNLGVLESAQPSKVP